MRFQIQNTKLRVEPLKAMQEAGTEVDHEEGQVGGIGHGGLSDIHKILQAPVLFGVAEIELDLEPQAVKVNHFFRREVEVGGEQNDVGLRLGRQIGFENHDDLEWEGEFFVEQGGLINLGAQAVLHALAVEVVRFHAAHIYFRAILGSWPAPRVRPAKGS